MIGYISMWIEHNWTKSKGCWRDPQTSGVGETSDGVVMDTNMMKSVASEVRVPPSMSCFCWKPLLSWGRPWASIFEPSPQLPGFRMLVLGASHWTLWKLVVISLSTVSHAVSHWHLVSLWFIPVCSEKLQCVLGCCWPAAGGLTNTCNFYNPSPAGILHPCVHSLHLYQYKNVSNSFPQP